MLSLKDFDCKFQNTYFLEHLLPRRHTTSCQRRYKVVRRRFDVETTSRVCRLWVLRTYEVLYIDRDWTLTYAREIAYPANKICKKSNTWWSEIFSKVREDYPVILLKMT